MQDYLQQHSLLCWYDLCCAVVVEIDNLLQQQTMAVESVGCLHLSQNLLVYCKACCLQLAHLYNQHGDTGIGGLQLCSPRLITDLNKLA